MLLKKIKIYKIKKINKFGLRPKVLYKSKIIIRIKNYQLVGIK